MILKKTNRYKNTLNLSQISLGIASKYSVMPEQSTMLHVVFANSQQAVSFLVMIESLQANFGNQMGLYSFVLKFSINVKHKITQSCINVARMIHLKVLLSKC